MDWKHITIGLISFGMGFFIGWYPTFESIRNYIVSGLSIGAIGLVIKVLDYLKKWKIDKTKQRLIHSKILVNNNLEFLANTNIVYDDKNDLGLYICIKGLPDSPKFNRYIRDVNAHLESGGEYKYVWNILQDRDKLIKNHNDKSRDFLNNFNYEIEETLKNKFHLEKWNELQPEPKRYYTKHITDIGKLIQSQNEHCNERIKPLKLNHNSSSTPPCYRLSTDCTLVMTHDENELLDIEKMILEAFDSAIKSKEFIELKKSFNDIADKHKLFIQEILTIIKRFEYEIPLDGICKTCT